MAAATLSDENGGGSCETWVPESKPAFPMMASNLAGEFGPGSSHP
jgi:hypothetical protein